MKSRGVGQRLRHPSEQEKILGAKIGMAAEIDQLGRSGAEAGLLVELSQGGRGKILAGPGHSLGNVPARGAGGVAEQETGAIGHQNAAGDRTGGGSLHLRGIRVSHHSSIARRLAPDQQAREARADPMGGTMRVAVLDDWQGVAKVSAEWAELARRGIEASFFAEPLGSGDGAATALAGYEILVAMRERMAFPATLIARLARLRMISLTGRRSPVLDLEACTRHGVLVCNTGGELSAAATAEIALGLLIGAMRHMPQADGAVRGGRFQSAVPPGTVLEGRTLGVIGLGRIGTRVAHYGKALGMRVLGWSPHLTAERAAAAGAEFTTKEALLAESDAVSLHVVLSEKTRGLLGGPDLARMKPGAVLVNSSRFALVDEAALISALEGRRIVAALDVFPEEPLPAGHPLLTCPNTVFTPHLGYCTSEVYAQFYGESVANILAFIDGKPIRMMNPEALQSRTAEVR